MRRFFKFPSRKQRCIIGEASQKTGASTKYITITGECQAKDLLPNIEYRFAGYWKAHPRYGSQFAFDSFTQPEPITREAIVGNLTQCPKIGMVRAEEIYNKLGHDCIAQIKADPLRDMIQSGVPCGQLTEIHRNAGEIVKACAAIRDNSPIDPMPTNFILDKNFVFSRMTPTREKVFETIKKIFEFEKEIRYESINPFNALQDCQIIVPLNEKSELARKALNPLLQDYFTPSPKQKTKSESLETLKMHGRNILGRVDANFS